MPDVTFEVWHDGDLFGEYTTNSSGEIFLYDLEPGTYPADFWGIFSCTFPPGDAILFL